jgi:hypothetical protein
MDRTNSIVSDGYFTDSSSIFSKDQSSLMDVEECESPDIDVTGPYGPFSEVHAFKVGLITNHSIQLKWKKPIDLGNEILQEYNIQFAKHTSNCLIPVSLRTILKFIG